MYCIRDNEFPAAEHSAQLIVSKHRQACAIALRITTVLDTGTMQQKKVEFSVFRF